MIKLPTCLPINRYLFVCPAAYRYFCIYPPIRASLSLSLSVCLRVLCVCLCVSSGSSHSDCKDLCYMVVNVGTVRLITGTLGCALFPEAVAGDHDEAVRRSEG